MKHKVFITGGSGYIGSLIVARFAKRQDVDLVISLDRKKPPHRLKNLPGDISGKIIFIQTDIVNNDWQKEVANYNPDIVVHCAWQIRSLYRRRKEKKQWLSNVLGSENVFDFVFLQKSVKRFVHFSTVASYGAQKENKTSKSFNENDPLRESDFRYAYEKKEVEDRLYAKYCTSKGDRPDLKTFVVRPASITGSYGRSRSKFGIQSVFSGKSKNIFHRLLSKILFFAPLSKNWLRQFVHEEDVVGIVTHLVFDEKLEKHKNNYEVFNLCPPGDPMLAEDMARIVGKKLLIVNPQIFRVFFFLLWHVTQGLIPTSRGGWKSYCYPVRVDGSKITKICGYDYKYGPQESFLK